MKQRIRAILENADTKRYIVLLCAQGISFGAALLNSILLPRMLTEADYGFYKFGQNFLNLIMTVALLGIPYSASRLLVQSKETETQRKIIGMTSGMMILISVSISAVLALIAGGLYAAGISINRALYFAIPAVVLIVLQQSNLTMLQGTGKVSSIAIQTFVPALTELLLLAGLFLAGIKELGFTQAWLIFCLGYLVAQVCSYVRAGTLPFGRDAGLRQGLLQEQRQSGRNVYFASLVGVASTYCINFVLGTMSGMEEYAVYALSWSLAGTLQMIPSIMGTVMYRKNAHDARLSRWTISFTLGVSSAAYICYVFALQIFVPLLFPAAYAEARWMGSILGAAMLINGLGDFFNRFISANGYGKYIRNSAFISGIFNIIGACIFMPVWKIPGVIITRWLTSSIYLVTMLIYYGRVVKDKERNKENEKG